MNHCQKMLLETIALKTTVAAKLIFIVHLEGRQIRGQDYQYTTAPCPQRHYFIGQQLL